MERAEKTILVVEDTAVVRALVASALRTAGYNVKVAAHGKDALALLFDDATAVDLLVTDLSMPVMGGGELINRMRDIKRYQHLPIVMLTADISTTPGGVAQSGRIRVMEKPVDLERLVLNADELLGDSGDDDANTTSNQPLMDHQVAKLLPLYKEEGRNHIQSISRAVEMHDNAALRDSAHALKGISITIGATSVEEVARKLEGKAKTHDTEGLPDLLEQLRQSFERYIAQPPSR